MPTKRKLYPNPTASNVKYLCDELAKLRKQLRAMRLVMASAELIGNQHPRCLHFDVGNEELCKQCIAWNKAKRGG